MLAIEETLKILFENQFVEGGNGKDEKAYKSPYANRKPQPIEEAKKFRYLCGLIPINRVQIDYDEQEAFEYLQNRSFIFQIAKKYSAAVDLDDLMQEGYLGLYEAVKHYQPDKGNLFLTYLVPGTDNMTVEDSLADPLDMEAEVLDSIAREQAEYLIWKIVDELNERQAKVIVGRYKENNTLNEVAKRLNLSNDRISQIEKQALLLLRDKEELTHIAEIYGYMNPYKGTGYNSFKYHGSAVENEAIRNIEKEERLSELERKIKEKKAEIQKSLNIDELFSNVLNFASQ